MGALAQSDELDEKTAEKVSSESWREDRNEEALCEGETEEEEEASEGPWRYQARPWLMDTWVRSVACWVEGEREGKVTGEVKASCDLSAASGTMKR